jgi:hypothetical protein
MNAHVAVHHLHAVTHLLPVVAALIVVASTVEGVVLIAMMMNVLGGVMIAEMMTATGAVTSVEMMIAMEIGVMIVVTGVMMVVDDAQIVHPPSMLIQTVRFVRSMDIPRVIAGGVMLMTRKREMREMMQKRGHILLLSHMVLTRIGMLILAPPITSLVS